MDDEEPLVLRSTAQFKALGHPVRHRLVNVLRQRPATLRQIATALGLAKGTVSYHVRVLREAGLVEARVDEQRRLYRLRPEPLRELDAWLAPYRWAWDASLDRLEARLGEMARGEEHGSPDPPASCAT